VIVRTLAGVEGSDREVVAPTWRSRRLLLAGDGQAFSLHDTVIAAGTETTMWYRNHVEAVYCIEGNGKLDDLDNAQAYVLEPGTVYLLDGHERHRVSAMSDLRMVCVFSPPCSGAETHDRDGSYPLLTAGEPRS
jgi:L-ectoine synthase